MGTQKQNTSLSSIESIIALMPGLVFWKDLSGNYVGCNNNLASLLNLSTRFDIFNKTDQDLLPKDLAEEATKVDQWVIQDGKEIVVEQPRPIEGKFTDFLIKKTPMYNEKDQVVGVLGVAFPIKELVNIKYLENLLTQDIRNFKVHSSEKIPHLSHRQKECFYYLIQGMSAKQISQILNLSQRTVEYYIEEIKIKFNCYKKSELIKKAITLGYLSASPSLIDH